MKNIVILTQYFTPEMGAPQTRLLESAIGLKKRGNNILIITAMPNYPKGKIFESHKGKFSLREKVFGLDVYRFILYPSNSKKSLPRIFSMLSFSITSLCAIFKIWKFKPDYILTESPPLTLALTGLTLAKLSGAKHITNVSDLWPLSALEIGAISKGRLYSFLERTEIFIYKKSFACFGQSQQIVEHIANKGAKKTLLFRNGVDISRFQLSIKRNRTENNKLKIVYAGLLGVAQGIYELCANIDFSKENAEFHIYGEGAEKTEIQSYLKENSDKGIYYHGSMKSTEVPATIMQYDISLIPLKIAIFGALPSKIYESMAAGLPIIFTGGGEGEEIVRTHKIGWTCEPGNYKQIADCINEIAHLEKVVLEGYKVNCINAAQNIFNRESQIEIVHQFLEQN